MHVIRLRKPWEKLGPRATHRQRVDVPEPDTGPPRGSAEPSGPVESPVTYRRRFNRPTGLAAGTPVVLRISDWTGELTSLSVNEQPVPLGPAPLEVDLTDRLDPHNQLELVLAAAPDGSPPRLGGQVTLSIAE